MCVSGYMEFQISDSRYFLFKIYTSGSGCSKLMMLLVNVSLKFQTLISEIHNYFFVEKCEKLLQCKNFSHFFFNKKFQYIWL